ncbi:MAG: hypothetical protein KDH96_01935 [Candidatus Riesia sp.]|nr:hypothetical protein [Candidatus Riesia sp.]
MDYLRKQLLSKAVLKNPSYVDGFDTLEDDPSIENVATYIERGSLFLKAGGKEERAALFLVRKNVHDLMVNFHGKASHYKHDNVASVEEELAMMKEDLGKQLFTELHLFPASSGYNLPEVPETSSNRALAILKLYRFDHMLSRLRKTWSPETAMYYAGSQQKDWFIYRAVYEEALKEIDLEEQNYEDENGDG